MPSFEHRLAMARLAFEPLSPKVKVLDVEKDVAGTMPGKLVGTIDVVRHLIREHPDVDFGLLLGADTHRDLMSGRWKESDVLVKLVRVVPVRRKGVDSEIAGPEFEEVSSTDCRRTTDVAALSDVLQPEVLSYIRQHRLYGFAEEST